MRYTQPRAVLTLVSLALLGAAWWMLPRDGELAGTSSAYADESKETGRIEGTISVASPDLLSDVVVFVMGDELPRTVPETAPAIDQRNKTFLPSLLVVTVGTEVQFPNSDRVAHNVFSTSRAATFDLGLYKEGTSRSVVMENPGVVDVYCNVHPKMAATVLVVPNDFYVRPDSDGEYVIEGLPPGTYDVAAWMAYGEHVTRRVEVQAGEAATFDADLGDKTRSTKHLNKEGKAYGPYK